MMKKILISLSMFFGLVCNHVYAQGTPKEEIVHGPFKTDLFPEGKIYFIRKGYDQNAVVQKCYPISFMLEYKRGDQVKKEKIDHYTEDGGCPEIGSVFFEELHNKEYVFVMVVWDSIHRGIGMNANIYQTYAYTKNNQGMLSLDKNISEDKNLSGFEGYIYCKSDLNPDGDVNCKVHYKYKTVAAVKAYLKKKYH